MSVEKGENMKKAVLDLSNCKYALEMHERFKNALEFPEHYGKNWSAFWDSLMYDSPVDYVEVHGEGSVAEELLPMLEKFHEILDRVKKSRTKLGWEFEYKIVD